MTITEKMVIQTPEQVTLEYALAGIGSRLLALIIDTLIQASAGVVLFTMLAAASAFLRGRAAFLGNWAVAIVILFLFLLNFGYFALFEALWQGQTPGKRLMRLRVMKDDGRPIGPLEAVARNLMRLVDQLPFLYGVAIVSVILSKQMKRLGDYVAGTVVVREEPARIPAMVPAAAVATDPALANWQYNAAAMTIDEYRLIETFIDRREQLDPDLRWRMATDISRRILEKLGATSPIPGNPEAVLNKLASDFRTRGRYQ